MIINAQKCTKPQTQNLQMSCLDSVTLWCLNYNSRRQPRHKQGHGYKNKADVMWKHSGQHLLRHLRVDQSERGVALKRQALKTEDE